MNLNHKPNPFEYRAASMLTDEQILDYYIEDHNYSRFIHSTRNIFLIGERGAGKTMTLKYNSFPIYSKKLLRKGNDIDYEIINIYIPCNTPLTHRQEYQLLEDFKASVISKHFLVLSIMHAMVETIKNDKYLIKYIDYKKLGEECEYILNIQLPKNISYFNGLLDTFQKCATRAQKEINSDNPNAFYNESLSFSSGVIPLIKCLQNIPKLKNSHFSLMLDDAHDLNDYQKSLLNSWIAYRDNVYFSFKVASAKAFPYSHKTASGRTILEGHDFTLIDMEQPYQNKYSDFGKLSRDIVRRRLIKYNINKSPEEYFPANKDFEKELKQYEIKAKDIALNKYPRGTEKQITDYVYKYARAMYFKNRSSKANRPPYSGFDMLVHLSTGVIRNLLEPCYWMYDKMMSDMANKNSKRTKIEKIPPAVQTEIIMNRSKSKWDWIRDGLDNSIEGCSRKQAEQLYYLFDNLAILFRERLLKHKSEPRAITFTISEISNERYRPLLYLLDIARRAQILYVYSSSSKMLGKREIYYVPNRILWPERGLDPHGQHARVSIKASSLWNAAERNIRIPFNEDEKTLMKQGKLFNE